VDQIEMGTAESGENVGMGRLPAGFCTFACAVYKWHQLHQVILQSDPPATRVLHQCWQQEVESSARMVSQKATFYRLALSNPGVVAWYSALRLEALVHLAVAVLSHVGQGEAVPGKVAAEATLQAELLKAAGDSSIQDVHLRTDVDFGRVDDWWSTFAWSGGGMVHVHVAFGWLEPLASTVFIVCKALPIQ
jgi:hypothetical protein